MIATLPHGRLQRLERLSPPLAGPLRFERYQNDPAGFARDVLHQQWTPTQVEIARLLLEPPYRVLVKAAHNVGKTHLMGGIVLWWHFTRRPSIVLTTAPKLEQVRDLLWKEIRRQGRDLVRFGGHAATRIDRGPDDFVLGTTASSSTAFQGHHGPSMLFAYDESVGIDPEIIRVTETMFAGKGHAWLCIFNPTDSASAMYQCEMARDSEGNATWHVVEMRATEHPNIAAEMNGDPPPVPAAIRLERLTAMLEEWAEVVTGEPDKASDINWPPGSDKWLRPGPLAEARLLGRWPSQATGVWSDALWRAALKKQDLNIKEKIVIGCDVARFGDDYTTIHVRLGNCSLHHEGHNGWDAAQIVGRLRELCRKWAAWLTSQRDPKAAHVPPESIVCQVDEDGIGGSGVVDHANGYRFIGISAASKAIREDDYPNKRSELWFAGASRARTGHMDLSRLPRRELDKLRQQLMAPTYKLDLAGRRVVEPKCDTKEKLLRSPDDADGLNLAYYTPVEKSIQLMDEQEAPALYGRRS